MKPNIPGIWEWFEKDGTKRLVEVVNVQPEGFDPHLRVYWWGGYYNVHDCPGNEPFDHAEWPDRWGDRVGDNFSLPEDQIYSMPSAEERKKMDLT